MLAVIRSPGFAASTCTERGVVTWPATITPTCVHQTAPLGRCDQTPMSGTQSVSSGSTSTFQVNCESQEEVDEFWARLSDGGEDGPCGWLKDRYGVSWQIVPAVLDELIGNPDPQRSQRAMKAMLGMRKIDIAELQRAADQA